MSMALRKQTTTFNRSTSKGMAISTVSGIVLPPAIDQPHATEDTGSSPKRGNRQCQPPQQHENQVLQMLADIKEQIKEQAQSDRNQEQESLDRENVIHEQETMRQLNNQLQTQIAALQDNQPSTQSKSEPEVGDLPTSEPLTS